MKRYQALFCEGEINLQQLAKVIMYYSSRLGLDYSHLAIMVSGLSLVLKRHILLMKVNLDIN